MNLKYTKTIFGNNSNTLILFVDTFYRFFFFLKTHLNIIEIILYSLTHVYFKGFLVNYCVHKKLFMYPSLVTCLFDCFTLPVQLPFHFPVQSH